MVSWTLPRVSTDTSIKRVVQTNYNVFDESLIFTKSSKKLQELKKLHELLKEISKFEDDQVKPHCATGTRSIAHKLEALHSMLDKYKLYMQHFKNLIVDTGKQTKHS